MNYEGPPIPEKIELLPGMSELTIRRRWRSWRILPLFLFAIAWDSFLVFWYTMALSGKGAPWLAIIFPIGHVAVGIGITYFVVASFLNVTDVVLSSSRVRVRTYPLPWHRTRDLNPGEIVDTRVKYAGRNQTCATYDLRYRTRENRERKLVTGLSEDEAEYLDFQVRKTLGLNARTSID